MGAINCLVEPDEDPITRTKKNSKFVENILDNPYLPHMSIKH